MKDINDNWDLFNTSYPKYKCNHIRLIELFGGIGAQCQALENLHADFEPYKYCEWSWKSCRAYRSLHMPNDNTDYSKGKSDEEIINYLFKKGISTNWNNPLDLSGIKRIDFRRAYSDIIATHNLVNIQQVHGEDLDISNTYLLTYLLTYSFPCQDLSLAGNRAGMEKGSGTRSGMLWEVERILNECANKPQILIMENVPQVITSNGWNEWINALSAMGYTNYVNQMNAKNYGIPQNRDRCYMVSILGEYSYEFPRKRPSKKCLKDFEEKNVSDKYYLSEKALNGVVYTGFNCKKLENRVDNKGITPTLASRDYKDPHLEIISVGNYMPSKRSNSEIVDDNGIAKIIMENHGTGQAIGIPIKNHTYKGYIEGKDGDGVYVQNMDKKRGCCQKGLIQTLKAHTDVGVVEKVFQLDTGYMENGYVWNENGSAPTLPTCVGGRTQVPKLTQKFQLNIKGRMESANRVYDENGIAPANNTCGGGGLQTKIGEMINENGDVKRYVKSGKVDRFKVGQIADLSFPNGYNKGPRVHNECPAINCTTSRDFAIKIGIIKCGEEYYAIRRLTPHEYMRLMGFPNYAYDRLKKVGLSDSTIYHLSGDSIVVQVLMCIFGELLRIDYDKILENSIENILR